MATAPSDLPEWITDSGARGEADRYEEPGAGLKSSGFVNGTTALAKFVNWIYYTIYLWCEFLQSFHTQYARLRSVRIPPVYDGDYGSQLPPHYAGSIDHYRVIQLPTTAQSGTGNRPRITEVRVFADTVLGFTYALKQSDASALATSWTNIASDNGLAGLTDTSVSFSYNVVEGRALMIEVNLLNAADELYFIEYSYYEIGAE